MKRPVPVFNPPPLPLDIRLMNNGSVVLMVIFAGMVLAALLSWLARQPVFSLKAIYIDNELVHNNAVTLRAHVAPKLSGTFFTLDLFTAKRAFENIFRRVISVHLNKNSFFAVTIN